MEITKMLTLSTIHIKPETAMLLNDVYEYKKDLNLIIYPKKWKWVDECFGWFIDIQEDLETDEEAYKDVPEDLMQCLLFARDLGCKVLCLDCDGEILSYLPKYHW